MKVTHIDFTTVRKSKAMLEHLKILKEKEKTLGQFIYKVKEEYRGKPFVKPSQLSFQQYNFRNDMTFSIDEKTQLVKNDFNGQIIEANLAKELFEDLFKHQVVLGQNLTITYKDYITITLQLPIRVINPLTNKASLEKMDCMIQDIIPNDDGTYKMKIINLQEDYSKTIDYPAIYNTEEELILILGRYITESTRF